MTLAERQEMLRRLLEEQQGRLPGTGTEADATDIDTLDTEPRRRRGTRIGFLLAIVLAAAAAGVYLNTDRIAEYVPTAAPYLDRYEDAVNTARFWLDDVVRDLAGATEGG
jgi:hypothetical protein